jgi:hypothetical protein
MKITAIRVTDEDGIEHLFEGVEGWLRTRTVSKKGQPYVQAVDAHLALAPITVSPSA